MKKILFVCTGNICRSPTAEAIARHKAKSLGLEEFIFDSAGIEAYHSGESPDARTIEVGEHYKVPFHGIVARKISQNDFEEFDFIMAMDRSHHEHLLRIVDAKNRDKVKLFLEFCQSKNSWNNDVIDPYYSDFKVFHEVFNVIDSAVGNLLRNLR